MMEGIGLTVEDLNLDFADDDLPPLPLDRPRYQPKGWWTTTDAEAFYLDLPNFEHGAQRARYMIEQMARAAMQPGSSDDEPLFLYQGEPASLNDLLATTDPESMKLLRKAMF